MKHIANVISLVDSNTIIAKIYKDDLQTGEFKIQDANFSRGYWYHDLDQLYNELHEIDFIDAWNKAVGMRDVICDYLPCDSLD